MAKQNPPSERLSAALKAHNWTRSDLARRLSVDPSAVSRWTNGKAAPDPVHRVAIERLLGIAQNDWLTDDERQAIENALGRTGTEG